MTSLDATIALALVVANTVTFFLMGLDKSKARRGAMRIPEKTLLQWCALLGAPGGWLGMRVFHHKTRDPKFVRSVPGMAIAQAVLLIVYLVRWR